MKKIVSAITLMVLISFGSAYAGGSKEVMLKNGIKFIEMKRDYTDTVAVSVMIKGGLYLEDEATNGVGSLNSRVILKSNRILENSEFYGASISMGVLPYSTEIMLSAPREVFDKLLPDFKEFLLTPKYDEEVLKREKKAAIEEIVANKDDPNTIAYDRFIETAYAGSPYAMNAIGKTENVEKLTLNHLKLFNKSIFEKGEVIVSVVGNFDDKTAKQLKAIISEFTTNKKFDYSKQNTVDLFDDNKTVSDVKPFKFTAKRVEDKDTRIKQAKLFIGVLAPAADDKNYNATVVLSEILGGGMSSRYFTEIRKNLGFAYSISSGYPTRVERSLFLIYSGLEYKNIKKAIDSIDEINKNLAKTLTDEEVEKGKNSVLGSFLMQNQTNAGIARRLAFYELIGLTSDYYDKQVDLITALTKKDILNAAEILSKDRVIYILKPAD